MRKKILLADDSLTIQKVVELTFTEEDYEVVVVGDGAQAVARIGQDTPDLVLADVLMPKKTGYEVCEFVKSNPATKHVPVLLLVGKFEPFDEERARRAGADGHILKPFESSVLVRRVTELLQASAAARVVSGTDVTQQSERVAAAQQATIPVFGGPAPSPRPVSAETEQLARSAASASPPAAPFAATEPAPFEERPRSLLDDDEEPIPAAPFPEAPPFGEAASSPFGDEPAPFDEPLAPAPAPAAALGDAPAWEAAPEPAAPAPLAEPGRAATASAVAGAVAGELAALAGGASGPVSDELIQAITERVVRRLSEEIVRDIAWQVVPDLAELLIKKKLEELG